jgi:hypothetical protein
MLNKRLDGADDDDDDDDGDVNTTLMMAGPSPMVARPAANDTSSSSRRPGGGRLSFHLPGEDRPDAPAHLRSPGLVSATTDGSEANLKGRAGAYGSFVGDPEFARTGNGGGGANGSGSPDKGGGSGAPVVDEATADLMDSDLDAITKQLTERETMHACDVMEQLLDQEYEGFSEDLFVACNDYLSHARKYDAENGTSIASFTEDAADLEHNRDVKQELAQYDTLSWQRKTKIFLEYADSGRWSRIFYFFLSTVVVLACVFTVLETVPEWNPTVRPEFDALWRASDWTFTIFLSFETGLRFYVNVVDTRFGSRRQNAVDFLKRPGNIADIVALLPTYIQPLMTSRGRVLTGSLRTARLLRLMKFLRRYQPIRRLVLALTRSVAGLIAPFCFLAMSLLFFASTVYYAERGSYDSNIGEYTLQDPLCLSEPRSFLNGSAAGVCPFRDSRFVSMGQSMWWGIVSMAAVGYGDFVPITTWGKFVGSVTMVAGVVFVAMPIAVIGANYTQVIETTQAVRNQSVEDRVMRQQQQDGSAAAGGADGSGGTTARKLTMPGEALINAMGRYLKDKMVDLRAPSPEVLFVVDALLEATVKELVDAQRVAARESPLFSAGTGATAGSESPASGRPTPQNPSLNPSATGAVRPPPQARGAAASAQDGTQVTGRRGLSLWTATVTADVPVNMPSSALADVMRSSSMANALSASMRNLTPRSRRRGASMAGAATRRITLAETTLSRPVVVLLGCSHSVDDAALSTFSMPSAAISGKRGSGGQHAIRQTDSVEGRSAAASRNHSLHDLHDYAEDLLCSVRGSPHTHFVPLYSRALHEQVARSIAQAVTTRAAQLDQLRTASVGNKTHNLRGGNAVPQERVYIPELAVSQRHATLALTRAWGEYVPLLYPLAGSRVYTVTGDLEHTQGTLHEVKVADARQIRASAREHLLTLAQRKADAILRKHKGTSAFAVRQREQAQEELRSSMRWESGEARFTFQHELLHHWVEMEQRPAVLAPGTVLQFGAAVDVGAPEYGDAEDVPEQRVAGGPASSGRQFALRFKFADNSVASADAVVEQQAAEKGKRPRFDSRMSLGGQSVMSVDESGAAATVALSSRGQPGDASFDGGGGRFGSPRSRSASVRGPGPGRQPGLVMPSPGSTGARRLAAATAGGQRGDVVGGSAGPSTLRRDRNGVPQFEL